MQHVILPTSSERPLRAPESWAAVGVSLGGAFYDYLCGDDDAVIGVRYWLMDSVDPAIHPVYRQFTGDRRIRFHQDGYVDMLFSEFDTSPPSSESLRVFVVQDFGGEHVVRRGDAFGIVFDVPSTLEELNK